jgi:anti-anti-sigma factor
MTDACLPPPPLTVRTDTTGNALVVRMDGSLVQSTALQGRLALLEALQAKPIRLVADLAQVSACDQVGIGTLLIVSLWARKAGVLFTLVASESFCEKLNAAGLNGLLPMAEPGTV